jgi:hypothetical protein
MALNERARGWSDLPGLRAFRVRRFRMLTAGLLVTAGLLLNVLFFVVLWNGYPPWLDDFVAYYNASRLTLDGLSPYSEIQLDGPIDAVCEGCYLYPPVLAQAITPLALLPLEAAKAVWFVLGSAAALAAIWLATGVGGARPSGERLLWCIAATAFFVPVFYANYYGNVGSFIALSATLVAMGGAAAGIGGALAVLVKVVPGALAPAVLVSSSRSRRSFVLSLVVLGGASFVLAPDAWLDYPTVFFNMLAGSTDYSTNLAFGNVAAWLGLSEPLVLLARAASVAAGVAAIALSVWMARRPAGMPAAALAGTVAMLIIPGTMWLHYLAVLLPFAAMAWPRAGATTRVVLFLGAALVVAFGLGDTYVISHIGAAAMVLGAGWVLWPRVGEDTGHGRTTPDSTTA